MVKLKVKRIDKTLPLPVKGSKGSSGFDIYSSCDCILNPFEFKTIPTGIAIELKKGYEAQIRPRSGLASKNGIGILNSPGTIDSDYRGEILVVLFNFSKKRYRIKKGDRIAQLVISKIIDASLEESENLKRTKRGKRGFGSTGR
uniref:Deoxyuridine 5'-triphosphate nucleotidohydrolase n=1 Tax=candidate division WOR-3 bacterium TaxID=2052148 RepID=A0A7C4Y5C0_UNCW3